MYGLTTIIIRLFPFILSPYIFEAFGPTAYAPYADFYSVAGIIIVLLTHGMETTFFRFALDEKDSKKLISTAFFSVLFAALSFLIRSEEHTSELQSRENLVCRLLLEKKKTTIIIHTT